MASTEWCLNCQQYVAPQKRDGPGGCLIGGLILLGLVLLFFNAMAGFVVLGVAAIAVVIGITLAVEAATAPGTCPICKAAGLLKAKPSGA
jgi:hypothetical protein